jgi:hypothetical protein
MRTRAANRKAAAGPDSGAGTGVFLPRGQSCEEVCEDALSTVSVEMHGSESDVDSLESASDCVMLEEEAPIKRGVFSDQMSSPATPFTTRKTLLFLSYNFLDSVAQYLQR